MKMSSIPIINGEKDNDQTCQYIQISTTGFWCKYVPYVVEGVALIEGCGNCCLSPEERLGLCEQPARCKEGKR